MSQHTLCLLLFHTPNNPARIYVPNKQTHTHTHILHTHTIYVTNGQQPRHRAAIKEAGLH